MRRIGVFVCHCGVNIAQNVDVKAVAEYASHLNGGRRKGVQVHVL
jgi:heterodisulfide reductase subunit A-like polyferredoxin